MIKMSWENIIKQADCKVKVCDAINCMYNANKRCTLDEITINSRSGCNQFSHINEMRVGDA